MRVRSLTLERYGAFTDRSMEFGWTGLGLVVGANEAGKSTALDALSDLLWGIPANSSQAFLHGWPALALRACLEMPGDDPVEVVRRSTGLSRTDTGEPVTGTWRTPRDSRDRWRESFGLSHAQLRDGGRQLCGGGGDLAELVFAARSGQAVRALLAELEATAASLYKEHRGNKGVVLRRAYADYEQAKEQVAAATANSSRVQAVRAGKEDAARAVGRAEQRVGVGRAAVTDTDQRRRAAPDARLLDQARRRAATVRGEGAVLDSACRTALEGARAVRQAADGALSALSQDLERLTAEWSSLVVEDALLADADDIRRLHGESEARLEDGRRALELFGEAAALGRAAAVRLAELVGDTDVRGVRELLDALHVPADRVTQLDGIGEELRRAEDQVRARHDDLQAAAKRVADADAARVDIDTDVAAAVREAYEAIRAAGSAASAQRAAVETHATAMVRRDEALRLAGLPTGAAVPARVPALATIAEVGDRLTSATVAVKEAEQRVERDGSSAKAARRDLEFLQDRDVPDADELTDARRARDAAVAELVTAWLQGRLPAEVSDLPVRVERATARADALADLLIAHADATARRAELARTLSSRQAQLDGAALDLDAATRAAEEADRAWRSLWAELGDACPPISEAAEIRRQLAAAQAAEEEMAGARSRIEDLQQQVDSQTTALSTALARAGRPRQGFDLDALLESARLLLEDADAAREGRARSDQLVGLEREARREHAAAVASCEGTSRRWQHLLAASGVPDDLDVSAWTRRRDIVHEARTLQRQADARSEDAEHARDVHEAFVDTVASLVRRHAVRLDGDELASAALARRVEQAMSVRTKAGDLDAQITRLRARVQTEQARRADALDEIEQLRAAAGVPGLEELGRAAERGRVLDELTADEERLTALVRAAAPVEDIDALVAELAVTDQQTLNEASASAVKEQDAAESALREEADRYAAAQQEERALTGSAGAAELHARAQEHLAAVAEGVERYLVARMQIDVLRGELEEYERKHASPLLHEAGLLLERLTGGRYVALGVTEDASGRGLVIVGADEERRAPSELSEGTADQVFLALRLAGIDSLQEERQASGAPPLPVVLDDVLMTSDDDRAAAALRVMADLARKWQVIVFSHSAHLAGIAQAAALDALTVSHLLPPPPLPGVRAPEDVRSRAQAGAGRRRPSTGVQPVVPQQARSSLGAGVDPGAVRVWARAAGLAVGERGRIPADVVAAYERAHS